MINDKFVPLTEGEIQEAVIEIKNRQKRKKEFFKKAEELLKNQQKNKNNL